MGNLRKKSQFRKSTNATGDWELMRWTFDQRRTSWACPSVALCLLAARPIIERNGHESGHVMRLVQIGLSGVALVLITLAQQGRAAPDAFEMAAARQQEILEVYLLAGSADYLVQVASRDAAHFEKIRTDILTQLPGVGRLHTMLALRTVKKPRRCRSAGRLVIRARSHPPPSAQ
jgi:Lrp/AsnC family transcriptional regulator, leucine-responsive regulatory protein